jgi:hypothetical protein
MRLTFNVGSTLVDVVLGFMSIKRWLTFNVGSTLVGMG